MALSLLLFLMTIIPLGHAEAASEELYYVSNQKYCDLLTSVAREDLHGLYTPALAQNGIIRWGKAGFYQYSVVDGKEDTPVISIPWASAARCANWLENWKDAKIPEAKSLDEITESGVYTLDAENHCVEINIRATYLLPSNTNEVVFSNFPEIGTWGAPDLEHPERAWIFRNELPMERIDAALGLNTIGIRFKTEIYQGILPPTNIHEWTATDYAKAAAGITVALVVGRGIVRKAHECYRERTEDHGSDLTPEKIAEMNKETPPTDNPFEEERIEEEKEKEESDRKNELMKKREEMFSGKGFGNLNRDEIQEMEKVTEDNIKSEKHEIELSEKERKGLPLRETEIKKKFQELSNNHNPDERDQVEAKKLELKNELAAIQNEKRRLELNEDSERKTEKHLEEELEELERQQSQKGKQPTTDPNTHGPGGSPGPVDVEHKGKPSLSPSHHNKEQQSSLVEDKNKQTIPPQEGSNPKGGENNSPSLEKPPTSDSSSHRHEQHKAKHHSLFGHTLEPINEGVKKEVEKLENVFSPHPKKESGDPEHSKTTYPTELNSKKKEPLGDSKSETTVTSERPFSEGNEITWEEFATHVKKRQRKIKEVIFKAIENTKELKKEIAWWKAYDGPSEGAPLHPEGKTHGKTETSIQATLHSLFEKELKNNQIIHDSYQELLELKKKMLHLYTENLEPDALHQKLQTFNEEFEQIRKNFKEADKENAILTKSVNETLEAQRQKRHQDVEFEKLQKQHHQETKAALQTNKEKRDRFSVLNPKKWSLNNKAKALTKDEKGYETDIEKIERENKKRRTVDQTIDHAFNGPSLEEDQAPLKSSSTEDQAPQKKVEKVGINDVTQQATTYFTKSHEWLTGPLPQLIEKNYLEIQKLAHEIKVNLHEIDLPESAFAHPKRFVAKMEIGFQKVSEALEQLRTAEQQAFGLADAIGTPQYHQQLDALQQLNKDLLHKIEEHTNQLDDNKNWEEEWAIRDKHLPALKQIVNDHKESCHAGAGNEEGKAQQIEKFKKVLRGEEVGAETDSEEEEKGSKLSFDPDL